MNLHISIVLVCSCDAAYNMLVMITKINMQAPAHEFLVQLSTNMRDLKKTWEELQNIRVLLTRMLEV